MKTAIYPGTFDPIKTIDDLKVVAKNNARTETDTS